MKLQTFLFLLPVLLISCSSCGSRKVKNAAPELPYHIDLTKSPPHDLFLSDFAEDISYVRLESKTIKVGGWCTVKAGKERFIIDDHAQELLAFSRNGNFLNKIGMIGQGPKEYPNTSPDYQIDPDNNEVFTPFNWKEVNAYSIQGQFIRNIKLPEFRPDAIIMANSRIFLSRIEAPAGRYVPLEVYLTDGTKCKEYSFQLPKLDSNPVSSPLTELSLTPQNDVIINITCSDTTFLVSNNGDWRPFIVYNRGAGKITLKETFSGVWRDSSPANYYTIYLKDLGKILVMVTCHGKESYFCFFNKKNGEFYRYNNNSQSEGPQYFSIQNDLDGGPGLIYHHSISGNFLYCVHQAFDLIEWKKSGYFDRIEPKFPEKKQKLFDMIDSLKPDDNPVIMIVKIKE
jgi:hypothetical protein